MGIILRLWSEIDLGSTGLRPADPLGALPPDFILVGALPPDPRSIFEAVMDESLSRGKDRL